jgi:serine/threonine-protein kinase
VGDVVDKRYELVRDIGRGAAGLVFEARHRFTHRRVALKIVSPDTPRAAQGELRARLLREARALAAARHPNVVDVLDGGIGECGTPYVVLELLEGGRTLEGVLATRGRVSVKDAVAIGMQVCEGLAATHAGGVVHRDVKPGNILIMRDRHGHETVKLVDFGIAHVDGARECKLTSHGAIVGTPEYMAPEQLLAQHAVDHLADVYAVGITLFECITGRVPFPGKYQQVLLQVNAAQAAPALLDVAPVVGPRLSAIVAKAIAKNRHDRYQNVVDLARDLAQSIPQARRRTYLFGPPPMPPAAAPNPTAVPTPFENPAQRRKQARANYATPVRVILQSGLAIDGRSEDVSEGGLLVIFEDADIAVGQKVTLRFALPMEGKVVTLPAEVRWERRSGGRRATGLQFVDPPRDLTSSVARYVKLMGVPKAG